MNDSIRTKIQKLFVMAERGNGNEAEVAMAKAQALMKEYGLTADDCKLYEVHTGKKTKPSWQKNLAAAICASCGTVCIITYYDYKFCGDEIGTTVAKELYEYLISAISRNVRENTKGYSRRLKNDYRLGIVSNITLRLRAGEGWRDMKQKQKEVADKYFSHTKESTNRTFYVNPDAFNSGSSHAKTISLNRQNGCSMTHGFIG